MIKATVTMTRTQNSYFSALEELGFKGGAKKESLSMTLELASLKIAIKITGDSSTKIVTTNYKADGTSKETTQTFFPPASEFATGVVLNHIKGIIAG